MPRTAEQFSLPSLKDAQNPQYQKEDPLACALLFSQLADRHNINLDKKANYYQQAAYCFGLYGDKKATTGCLNKFLRYRPHNNLQYIKTIIDDLAKSGKENPLYTAILWFILPELPELRSKEVKATCYEQAAHYYAERRDFESTWASVNRMLRAAEPKSDDHPPLYHAILSEIRAEQATKQEEKRDLYDQAITNYKTVGREKSVLLCEKKLKRLGTDQHRFFKSAQSDASQTVLQNGSNNKNALRG